MKKIIFAFILICPVFVYCSEKKVTLQNLADTVWEWHSGAVNRWPEFSFKFKSNGSMELIPESASYGFGEGGGVFVGNYKIVNDELIINYKYYSAYDSLNNPGFKPVIFEKRSKILYFSDSVQYDTYAKFDGTTIICKDSIVREGLPGIQDGVDVVTAGGKTAVVTKNAKIRVKPDVNAQFINFGVDLGEEGLAYCPAGKELNILARTKEKVKIEKWNNYWYYAELTSAGEFGARYGWIYGEFLRFK